MSTEEIIEAVRSLEPRQRSELIRRLLGELAARQTEGIYGLFEEETDLIDEVVEAAMSERSAPLRDG